MKSVKLLISVALVSVLALGACKSTRTASPTPPITPVSTPGSEETNLIQTIAETYGEWTDVKMPVKIELLQPKKFSASGNLCMTAGKAVGISLRMFGMEVGNVYVDADSLIAVVKPMGVYYAESTARFTAAAGFGLDDIQALLLGRAFAPGNGQLTTAMVDGYTTDCFDDGEYILMPKVQAKEAGYFYTAALGTTPAVSGLAVEISGHKPVLCNFADIRSTPVGTVAEKMRLRATVRNNSIECNLTTNASKAEWNRSITVARPSIPRNARRLSTEQLLNLMKSL